MCGNCQFWTNKIKDYRLQVYKETEANIGNGYSEIGICERTSELQYFDHNCDCDLEAILIAKLKDCAAGAAESEGA